MYLNSKLAKSVRLALALGAASTTAFTANVSAQEESAEGDNVEKIAVTGSRIRKADFVSNAPVATIGAEQFQLSATVNTESLLNTLPQVIPGLDRTSNNPGNGTATVDLRGLGTNRTLVLINGTRAVPTTSGGTVDINNIPTALIEDVEVLTGGASAVYGSDAVAGVVNFILKDDFEGVQTNMSYEVTEEGDAAVWSTDITLGGNFADGKGNVVFNMSYTDREELFQGDRDFAQTALFDDGNGGLEPGGSSGVPGTSIFAGGLGTFSPDSFGIVFDQNGSARPFVTSGQVNDFYNYAPVNYIQLPQERHQFTALGNYEISENAEIYARAMFTDSRVPQQLAPTPIFQTATFTLDGNPFIADATEQMLSDALGDGVDTDGDGIDDTATAFLRRRLEEVGPRVSNDSFNSFQFLVGLRGAIGDSSWTYDVNYSTGKANNLNAQLGNVNRGRFNQALLLATDANGQVILDANGNPSCADTSTNGSTINCAPMNLFGEGNISQDAADFLKTAVSAIATFDQRIFSANVSGDTDGFFELPGGPVGMAFGYDHQDHDFVFLPSQDLAAGTIAGFSAQPGVAGGYTVSEVYGEIYLPILDGAPMADLLDMELAYRSADYSTVGSVESYKIAASWAPVEEVRFRAGFNTAVRAPNIGELFSPRNEGFPGAIDPCSALGTAATDAGVAAICAATGVPANVMGSPALNLASNQVRAFGGGNPNLKEEEAETLTVGVVLTPMEDLSISFDYFDIEIEDAVSAFGGGASNILNTCYDPTDPLGGAGSPFCNAVTRRADGTIFGIETAAQNVATQTLVGYDLIASYSMDVMDGTMSIDYLGTYTKENDFLPFAGGTVLECAGKFGTVCGEPVPEYKHRVTVKWSNDDLTAQLLWRYVGEVDDDDDTTDYSFEQISAYSSFDASASYHLSDNYQVTAGIDNLFNKKPPVIGGNDEQSNTYPATYDVFGRTYYVNFKATF
jgi:outer membrane receptor protein involved in Fe transport